MIHPEKRTILTSFTWKAYGGLEPRKRYRVIRAFEDFDGDEVPAGFQGTYRAYDYFPYDDGLSLAFDTEDGLAIIRLQMRPGAQQEVGDNLEKYFSPDESLR